MIIADKQTANVDLAVSEDLYITRSGQLYAAVNTAITVQSDSRIDIAGELLAAPQGYFAIELFGGDNTIAVHETGLILNQITLAIDSSGTAGTTTLVNYGYILGGGSGGYAVWINNAGDVTNHGVIDGGILMNTNSAFVIRNYGTISGRERAVDGAGFSSKLVVNAGILDGDVRLGFGDDTLDSRTGSVYGTVMGDEGDDVLLLGATNDTIDGGAGADEISGGGGFDYASYDSAKAGVVAYLTNLRLNTGDAFGDSYSSIEGLIGSDFSDTLGGDNGANIIRGGLGADVMRGYGGDDKHFVDNVGDRVIELDGGGFDRIYSGASYTLAATAEVEVLSTLGTASMTVLSLTGNGYDNVIMGNSAGNGLSGVGGDDHINGYVGNDRLYGGAGTDVLIGGAGLDSFYFDTALNATANVDRILDFSHADDTIRLAKTIFTTLLSGSLSADAFVIGAAAADASDRIVYNKTTGALFYDGDGQGGAAQVQFATLDTGLALASNDIFVY
jgi:hypothetical protein